MFEHDDLIEQVARELRRPVRVDPDLDARVMTAVAAEVPPGRSPLVTAWEWLRRPRTVQLSPLGGLVAAAIVAVALLVWRPGSGARPTASSAATDVRFVYVDRGAESVVLVGDFNDWNAGATPLRRTGDGVWTALVPLSPGRYRYAFMVDGTRWTPDPAAPRAGGDDFGTPNSVVTVPGAS